VLVTWGIDGAGCRPGVDPLALPAWRRSAGAAGLASIRWRCRPGVDPLALHVESVFELLNECGKKSKKVVDTFLEWVHSNEVAESI
jgi:hypothetical protein